MNPPRILLTFCQHLFKEPVRMLYRFFEDSVRDDVRFCDVPHNYLLRIMVTSQCLGVLTACVSFCMSDMTPYNECEVIKN